MTRFLALALGPALVILGALLATFAYVGHAEGIAAPPWGFIAVAVGVALFMGTCAAIADWVEGRPCH